MARFVIYRGSVPAGNYPNVKGASIQKPKPTVDTSERLEIDLFLEMLGIQI